MPIVGDGDGLGEGEGDGDGVGALVRVVSGVGLAVAMGAHALTITSARTSLLTELPYRAGPGVDNARIKPRGPPYAVSL
jgi:hypothetical protein